MLKINYLSKPILILSIFFLMFGCAKEEDEVKEEDTAKPTNVSIKINNDNSSTSSKTVNLQLYSKDNTGVTAYYLSQDYSGDSNASGWITISSTTTYNQTVSYTLNTDSCSSSTCLIYVYVWFKDAAGNTSSYNYDYIYYSPTAPTNPSISINGGDASTDNTSVTLSLSALDDVGVVGYFIADNGSTPSADASGWTTVTSTDNYSDNISYTLSGSAGSLKTINVWFKDVDGTLSSSDNDSIMYCGSGTTTMDEVEPNNSTSTAMDLCPTSLITGGYDGSSVEASGSHSDFFKVTATSNTMTVALSHVTANASGSDWDVVVYNSSGTQVDSFDADNGVNASNNTSVTSGQLYYIEVESQQWQTTYKYTLRASF